MRTPIALALALIALAVAAHADIATLRLSDFEPGSPPVFLTGEGLQPASKASLTTEQATSGKQSAALRYDFIADPKGLQYVGLGAVAPMVGKPTWLSAMVYGDNSGEWLRLRLSDATGETFQWNLAPITWQGWKLVNVNLTPTEPHWGGNNDGKLDYPLHFDSLLLDSNIKPKQGTIYVDDIVYVTDADPGALLEVSFVNPPFGNVFWVSGRTAETKMRVRNLDQSKGFEGTLAYAFYLPSSPYSVPSPSPERDAKLGPGGYVEYPFDPGILPDITVEMGYGRADRPYETYAKTRYTVLHDPAPLTLMPDSPFGACTHFGQGKGSNPETFKLMSRAGIKYMRDEISWGLVEQQKGKYTFDPRIDDWMKAAVANGVSPLILFDYGNGFYDQGNSPTSPEAQAAFGEYCFQLVNHYKSLCHVWEVYNEPNIGFWVPKPDAVAYARLMKIAYAAAKRADPTCTVLGICTAGTDLTYMETVLKEGGAKFMDALSCHPYRYPGSPEKTGFVKEITAAHELMVRYGIGDKPMWLTEIGWPTQKDASGVTEQVSGNYLVRMYTQALSLPYVRNIEWYDFQDDGTDEKYNEMNFGLIHWNTYTPKANFISYKMLTHYLTGKKFVRQLLPVDEKDRRYCYEFAGSGGHVLVAWYDGGAGGATFRTGMKSVAVQYADGRKELHPTIGGDLAQSLTDLPVFIPIGAQEGKVVASLVEVQGDTKDAIAGEHLALAVVVRNPSAEPLTGTLSIIPYDGEEVRAAGLDADQHPLPASISVRPGREQTVRVRLKVPAEDGPHRVDARLDCPALHTSIETSVTVDVVSPFTVSSDPPVLQADGKVTQVVALHNTLARAVSDVSLKVMSVWATPIPSDAPPNPITLGPGQSVRVTARYSPDDNAIWHQPEALLAATPAGGTQRTFRFAAGAWPVARAAAPPPLDCDPAKWRLVPNHDAGVGCGNTITLRDGSHEQDKRVEFRLQWDENALYLLAVVDDDKYFQPYHGEDVWQGDNIQLAVDARHTAWRALNEGKTPPFAEIGLSRTDTGDEAYRWLWQPGPCRGVALKTARVGNQTIYQAAIPWAEMGPVVPQAGDEIGFSLLVNGNDGQGRDGWLEWGSGIGYGPKDPRKYGTFVLKP